MKQLDGRILQLKRLLGNGQSADKVVEETANTFNVTPLYLKQLFKEQTGKTVLQFDKDVRLERAKEFFETTFKRANEVCFEVGFKDYSHFERDFYHKFGISPSELQKQSWLKIAEQEIANKSS
jgi:two-component system response regulator YesN